MTESFPCPSLEALGVCYLVGKLPKILKEIRDHGPSTLVTEEETKQMVGIIAFHLLTLSCRSKRVFCQRKEWTMQRSNQMGRTMEKTL